ncbi:hypothetical protein ACFU8W_06880 [Streptomyces sp. NPDC057565]|uniref:hypothetical protein n=1 Tax=Streptomyces sp. NPDC057565 TaxID=3346169 RepID=UPI0036CF79BC
MTEGWAQQRRREGRESIPRRPPERAPDWAAADPLGQESDPGAGGFADAAVHLGAKPGDRPVIGFGRDGKPCGWSLLQGRYTLAVIFEYAATLGLIDIPPDRAHVGVCARSAGLRGGSARPAASVRREDLFQSADGSVVT